MGDALLYPWQAQALTQEGVMEGRNLVYCAPTSGGKSLVAEILALRRLYATGRAILLVLPFVSLCHERALHWEKILEPLGYKVGAPCCLPGTHDVHSSSLLRTFISIGQLCNQPACTLRCLVWHARGPSCPWRSICWFLCLQQSSHRCDLPACTSKKVAACADARYTGAGGALLLRAWQDDCQAARPHWCRSVHH